MVTSLTNYIQSEILKNNTFVYLGKCGINEPTYSEIRNVFRSTKGSHYVEFSINFVNDYIVTEIQ